MINLCIGCQIQPEPLRVADTRSFSEWIEEATECVKRARNCLATELAALVRIYRVSFGTDVLARFLRVKLLRAVQIRSIEEVSLCPIADRDET